jgi:hypothetical protein
VDDRQRHVVEASAQVVALERRDARRLALEEVREEVEVVDRVALRHAHVGARALEA